MNSTMYEILAPAGDKNCALAAINAGADAIYLGLKQFSARSAAENFDIEEFTEIVKYAHVFGVKVYVAMNTLVKNSELEDFLSSVLAAWNCGADAIIISDIFLGEFIKKHYPEITLHLSTQAGVCNVYGAELAKQKGFSRVILARETSFNDIINITKKIETEVFVQGALCTCFSGQCYFSSFAGGNSGNRGKCKQPCRKLYSLDRDGFNEQSYKLSLSDLSIGKDICKLISAGVTSFKIEGRMRRPEYVSAAVTFYKNILQGKEVSENLSDLKRTYNRGNYTTGLAFGQGPNFVSSAVQGHIGEFCGVIKIENGKILCLTDKKLSRGCGFKILRSGKEIGGAVATGMCRQGIILNSSARLKNGDKAFITTDIELNEKLLSYKKLINLSIKGQFFAKKPAKIIVNGEIYFGSQPLEEAKNKPFDKENFEKCFKKTDKFPFDVIISGLETDSVFITVAELNALRRKIYEEHFDFLSFNGNKQYSKVHKLPVSIKSTNRKTAVIAENLNGISADIGIFKSEKLFSVNEALYKNFKGEKYFYIPPYLTEDEIKNIMPAAEKFDGIYSDGIHGFQICKILNKPFFAGTGLNFGNTVDVALCSAEYIALSKELTLSEVKSIKTENTFYLTAGNIKIMDLIYCPFEKKCANCQRRKIYELTDSDGRKFPLRRYTAGSCRFEVFNCANLISDCSDTGIFLDCTLENNVETIVKNVRDTTKLTAVFKNYTRGHSVQPIK